MIKLSVIIPVYNGEKYIRACVKSILKDKCVYEVIAIDDGSSDNSLRKLNKLNKEYDIKVVHTENKGVSHARNIGLKEATGDYITFVDCDDLIKPGTYKTCIKMLGSNQPDVMCFPMARFSLDDKIIKPIRFKDRGICKNFIRYAVYSNSVCNKLFRREFLVRNGISFQEDIPASEDFLLTFEAMIKAKDVVHIREGCYLYRENPSSATSVGHSKNYVKELKQMYEYFYKICEENDVVEPYRELIKAKKLFYATRYLARDEIFDIDAYRRENKEKYIWNYPKWRLDYTIATICGNLNIKKPLYMYIYIRRHRKVNT